ncbi:MAG TPA: caspase family protein [Saprospiraceae bacterium]|nr:caspase family protein [Saprospiraceae bacterium]
MMTKRFLIAISILAGLLPGRLHGQLKPLIPPQGTTRAVIVGVSEYSNERIPRLQFAHADADAFARFLRSEAGGAVPENQIKLLTNRQATQGQMAAALTWLLEESKEGDMALIFFSGHGDMETQTVMNHGFLLTHDAPASTYMAGGAFPVFYLQSIVQTLSTQRKAQVALITDACHAGKLAGSANRGAQATAQLLAEQFANEARLLSCQPDEFSAEGAQWGGGHGVFTYFLLDGLTGLADANQDQTVTLLELQRFLEDQVPAAVAPASQIPLVSGNKGMKMARVNEGVLAALKERRAVVSAHISNTVAFRSVAVYNPEDSTVQAMYSRFQSALSQKRLLPPAEDDAYSLYITLRKQPAAVSLHNEMRRSLAAALMDEAQQAINDYLAANPLELRRRWSFDARYEQFPTYLQKAAEVLGETHFAYRDLQTKALYFNGLNLRLRGERERNRDLYRQADSVQQQVLASDPNAAYAYNELGLLARRMRSFETAATHFQQALALSPTWVLAETNLCATLVDLMRPAEAEASCRRALQYDSTFALAHHNLGAALAEQQQWDAAIASLQKALSFDDQYYLTHWKLGDVYYAADNKEQALNAWKGCIALEPTYIPALFNAGIVCRELMRPEEALSYFQQVAATDPNDVGAWVEIAELHTDAGLLDQADTALQEAFRLSPDSPDVYYAAARLHCAQKSFTRALSELAIAVGLGFDNKQRFLSDAIMSPLYKKKEVKRWLKACKN